MNKRRAVKKRSAPEGLGPQSYVKFLGQIKKDILQTQLRSALSITKDPKVNYATVVAQIPWGHNVILLDKAEDPAKCLWYAQQVLEGGWGRIEAELSIKEIPR